MVLKSTLLYLDTSFRQLVEVTPAPTRGRTLVELHCVHIDGLILGSAMHETIKFTEDVFHSAVDIT